MVFGYIASIWIPGPLGQGPTKHPGDSYHTELPSACGVNPRDRDHGSYTRALARALSSTCGPSLRGHTVHPGMAISSFRLTAAHVRKPLGLVCGAKLPSTPLEVICPELCSWFRNGMEILHAPCLGTLDCRERS